MQIDKIGQKCNIDTVKKTEMTEMVHLEYWLCIFMLCFQEVPVTEQQPNDCDILTEEQKKQLSDLQLFKNKEGNVPIEVGFRKIIIKKNNPKTLKILFSVFVLCLTSVGGR